MDNYITVGMQFGDEGKGSFVDYLVHKHNAGCVIRYNGGSQASHTVVLEDGIFHKFSQLGSGMFLDNCHTYLTENMVVNLQNLIVEMYEFYKKTGIPVSTTKKRVHIHENCYVVTPYHKLINKLREFSLGEKRRGTVGTGVSEVMYLLSEPSDIPLGVQVKDIYNPDKTGLITKLEAIKKYVKSFYKKNRFNIWKNVPEEMKDVLKSEIAFVLSNNTWPFSEDFFDMRKPEFDLNPCIYSSYELTLRKEHTVAVYEGSQGLLLDRNFGIKPNTTFLDTTINYALDISYYRDSITKIGIVKAFMTRHGPGIFPTESKEVGSRVFDAFQHESFWNGKIRFGWFDAVLLRYAQKVNQVDQLYLSGLDELSSFERVRICNSYMYKGTIDDEFSEIFEYYTDYSSNEKSRLVVITDIKRNSENLGKYLENCIPQYIEIDGWKDIDISEASEMKDLPKNCLTYINMLRLITKIPVTLVSVGRTRENKIIISTR